DVPGRPALYATTKTFLDDLGLRTLQELPALDEIVHNLEIETTQATQAQSESLAGQTEGSAGRKDDSTADGDAGATADNKGPESTGAEASSV
ncbi:MAG: SMC-Scp complex subunit ScpB, partial [Betaproteobacteria bacterium]|nr:SMC-Scp complex subunit ScpB [Betaproteobacteria bacterium]